MFSKVMNFDDVLLKEKYVLVLVCMCGGVGGGSLRDWVFVLETLAR